MKHALFTGPIAALGRCTAVAALIVVAGCAGPQGSETFYALNDGGIVVSTPSAGPVDRTLSLPGIVISTITVPELIDRPQIVTRDSMNRVVVSEQHLWAEPIRSGIGRTLATRLGRTMKDAGIPVQVAAYPQSSITSPYVRVTVDIVRFDAVPNGEAIVDALWSIRRVADNSVQTGRTTASSPIAGVSYEAIVAAWNDALIKVERDISANIVPLALPPAAGGN